MSLQVNDKQILKSYNKIWEKVERLMFTEFDSEPTYGDDDKYIKTKIKSYKDSITTNFYKKDTCKCPLCIQKYYPQIFLEECKYKQQQQKQQEQQQHQ